MNKHRAGWMDGWMDGWVDRQLVRQGGVRIFKMEGQLREKGREGERERERGRERQARRHTTHLKSIPPQNLSLPCSVRSRREREEQLHPSASSNIV